MGPKESWKIENRTEKQREEGKGYPLFHSPLGHALPAGARSQANRLKDVETA